MPLGSPSSGPRVGEAALGPGGKAWPSRFRMVFRGEVPHVRSGGWSDVVAVEGGSAPVPRTVRHVGGGAGPSGRGQRADGAFVGDGCAISQASADIMLGMISGKTKDESLRLGNLFLRMIKGEASDEEIDELEDAGALKDISHMPARVKCAVLGWHTLEEAFKQEK